MSVETSARRNVARWWAAVFAALLMLVLVLGMVRDITNYAELDPYPSPRTLGDDSLSLAGSTKRARVLSYLIGMAAREAVGADARATLVLPSNPDTLTSEVGDSFAGRPQPTIQPGLIKPLLGDRVRQEDYDPVLPEATVQELLSAPGLQRLPRGVFAVRAGEGDVVRVYSDAARRRIFVIAGEMVR